MLVVGAGPAGSACARTLALAGWDVLLVDAQTFPRDKTCGDGLIPDTFAALGQLGLRDRVSAQMSHTTHAHCQGPRGGTLRIPGELGVLRRRELDQILLEGAREAGAAVAMPWRLAGVNVRPADGRVIGARLRQGDREHVVQAQWVVLATGAAVEPLLLADLCRRRKPSAMAIRGYVRHEGLDLNGTDMRFVWHPALSPGYGWIFPMGQGRYNVGVGVDGLHGPAAKRQDINLRALFARFCEVHPMARELQERGQWEGDLKGAPLRCDLDGAEWSRPGLLLAGEAAGSTYAFTGEGIGKALETGMAAARAIMAVPSTPAVSSDADDQAVMMHHRLSLAALQPRYRLYRKAMQFNRWPWMIDLAIWRARTSPRIVGLMSDVLAERRLPDSLLSWRGIKRLVRG